MSDHLKSVRNLLNQARTHQTLHRTEQTLVGAIEGLLEWAELQARELAHKIRIGEQDWIIGESFLLRAPKAADNPGDRTEARPFNEDTDCPGCLEKLDEKADAGEAFCWPCRKSGRAAAYMRGCQAAEAEHASEIAAYEHDIKGFVERTSELHDRLVTIVDEAFGLQPVQETEELLTLLEHKLMEDRHAQCKRISELEAQLAERTRDRDMTARHMLEYASERDSLREQLRLWEATREDGRLCAEDCLGRYDLDNRITREREGLGLAAERYLAALPKIRPCSDAKSCDHNGILRDSTFEGTWRCELCGASGYVAPEPAEQPEPTTLTADSDDAADAREQSAQEAVDAARPRFIQEVLYYAGMMLDEDWPSHSLGHIEQAVKEFRSLLEKQARVASGEEAATTVELVAQAQVEPEQPKAGFDEKCTCIRCSDMRTALNRTMSLCSTCGNKRCPKATYHNNECTGSNEPGQPGSDY